MTNTINKRLVLGGARSGKSRFAEQQATQLNQATKQDVIYVATATGDDDEMVARIERHRQQRNDQWQLIEEPLRLSSIFNAATPNSIILVDCLTLWLSNCLHAGCWPQQRDQLLDAFNKADINTILVSNEVGSGIIPMGQLSREFVDEIGWLHQRLAEICNEVTLLVAGLPMTLK